MGLCALATLPAQTAPLEKVDLILDWLVNPNHAAIIVAKEQGFFEDEGLDVHIHEPTDPSMPPKLVAAQKYDLAVTYPDDFWRDREQGLPLTKVSTVIASDLACLIVLKDSGITKLSQLEGKKIGYSIPSEVDMINTMLSYGQTAIKSEKVHVGWNISQSLLSGRVAAVSGGFRNVEPHQLTLSGKEFNFYTEHGIPPVLIIVGHAQAKKTARFAAFNRAMKRAALYIFKRPKQAVSFYKQR